jgi:hypothetical protein
MARSPSASSTTTLHYRPQNAKVMNPGYQAKGAVLHDIRNAPHSGLPAAVPGEDVHRVAASGRQAPGQGSLARGTHVRQLQLPPDNARYREHHGRLPPVTPGTLAAVGG